MLPFFLFLVSADYDNRYDNWQELHLTINDGIFKDLNRGHENGGAIYIKGCKGYLNMNYVYFYNNYARSSGGAVFCECSNGFDVTAIKVCVFKCYTTQNCMYGQYSLSEKATFQHNMTSISQCANKQGASVFQVRYLKSPVMYNWNSSQSYGNNYYTFIIEGNAIMENINIQNSPSSSLMTMFGNVELTNANFVSNVNKYDFISVGGESTFTHCFFKENTGILRCHNKVKFNDCYFDNFLVNGNYEVYMCATDTTVFPTNFDIFARDGCVAVTYEGVQNPATEELPRTPYPSATFAPTNWPSQTPQPTPEVPAGVVTGFHTEPVAYSNGRICIANAIFCGLTSNAVTCHDASQPMRLEVTETTFYGLSVSNSDTNPGGCIRFENQKDNNCYSMINRTCATMCFATNAVFGSFITGTSAYNHANYTTLSRCSPNHDKDSYNTVEFRSGIRVFDSWNSSDCYTYDTAGIFTEGKGSEEKGSILYATFESNNAERSYVLNDENSKLLQYSSMNIVNNTSHERALINMYNTRFELRSSIVLRNTMENNQLFAAYILTNKGHYSETSEFYMYDCIIQSGYSVSSVSGKITESNCTSSDDVQTRVLTHYANMFCNVKVSAVPLAPEATFPTRCQNVAVTDKLQGKPKTVITKTTASFSAAVLSEYI